MNPYNNKPKDFSKIYFFILYFCLIAISLCLSGPPFGYAVDNKLLLYSFNTLKALNSVGLLLTSLFIFLRLKRLGSVLTYIFCFIVGLELSFKLIFGERVSIGVLNSIIDTNQDEASSMLIHYSLLVVLAVILSIALYLACSKVLRHSGKIFLTCQILILSLIWALTLTITFKDKRSLFSFQTNPSAIGGFSYHLNTLAYGDLAVLITAQIEKWKFTIPENKAHSPNVHLSNKGNEIVVLLLGETSLSKRYSLYGYNKNTSPELSKLLGQNHSCFFDKVHSASALTRDSVAMTISFKTPDNNALLSEKSVIDYAQENDYEVAWLTSQTIKSGSNVYYGYVAQDSNYVDHAHLDDDRLAELFADYLNRTYGSSQKLFFVLHMAGSHLPYKERYNDTDAQALPDADDYDRSIHKTDRIYKKIYDSLEQSGRQYTLFFTSDHGEIVGKGHGLDTYGIDQYLIPYIISSSDDNPQICSFIEQLRNKNGYINALSNKFVLLKLLGYELDQHYLKSEISNDRVLSPNGRSVQWDDIILQENSH